MSEPFHNWPYDRTFAAIAAATSATSNISISVEKFAESFGEFPTTSKSEAVGNVDDILKDLPVYVSLLNMGGDHCGHGLASDYPTIDFEDASGVSRADDSHWVKLEDVSALVANVISAKEQERAAKDAVESLFKDLRDRRFLKWLFDERGEKCLIGVFRDGSELRGFDLEAQQEIRRAWQQIIERTLFSNCSATRPAAPVEGLETVGYVTTSPTGAEVFQRKPLVPGHGQFGYKQDAVVTRSQAEELLAAERAETMRQVKHWSELYKQQHYRAEKAEAIIAAKDKKIADLENELSSFRSSFKEQSSLKANNEALTARVKELEHDLNGAKGNAKNASSNCIYWRGQTEALEKQLATTRKALEFYSDVHKYPAPLTGGMGDLWRDCGEIARNALTETFMPTHTHLKRGSSYSYFGTGTFQTDSWVYPHRYVDMGEDEEDMLSCDMQQVAVYLEDDGKIWVRPVGEFNDGRFAKV